MPRPKKKYSNPAPLIVPAAAPQPQVWPYSFDLKGASIYTGYSVWSLRQAIYAKQLPVANSKPYLIRRADLEAYVDSRVKRAA
jgi:hypothetical protein